MLIIKSTFFEVVEDLLQFYSVFSGKHIHFAEYYPFAKLL